MHRVNGPGSVSSRFRDRNDAVIPVIRGTVLAADWFTAVQEEIARCIERSGQTLNGAGEAVASMRQLCKVAGQSFASFITAASGSTTITLLNCQNVASVVNDSDGIYTITWDRDFSSGNYAILAAIGRASGFSYYDADIFFSDVAAGSCKVHVRRASGDHWQVVSNQIYVLAIGELS